MVTSGSNPDPNLNPDPNPSPNPNQARLGVEEWACHVDLHETTDTDESEFRPAKARYSQQSVACSIFYYVCVCGERESVGCPTYCMVPYLLYEWCSTS